MSYFLEEGREVDNRVFSSVVFNNYVEVVGVSSEFGLSWYGYYFC